MRIDAFIAQPHVLPTALRPPTHAPSPLPSPPLPSCASQKLKMREYYASLYAQNGLAVPKLVKYPDAHVSI